MYCNVCTYLWYYPLQVTTKRYIFASISTVYLTYLNFLVYLSLWRSKNGRLAFSGIGWLDSSSFLFQRLLYSLWHTCQQFWKRRWCQGFVSFLFDIIRGYLDPPRLFARRKYIRVLAIQAWGHKLGPSEGLGHRYREKLSKVAAKDGSTHTRDLGDISYDMRSETTDSELYKSRAVSFDREGCGYWYPYIAVSTLS